MAFDTTNVTSITHHTLMGWHPWRYIPSSVDTLNMPFGRFPYNYLPASEVWINAEVAHCNLTPTFSTIEDPFTAFLPLATTGGVLGALTGLEVAKGIMEDDKILEWGLSRSNTDTARLGYCIGTYFKEQVYTYMMATKLILGQILSEVKEDIIHRSRFTRFYLYMGEIQSVTTLSSTQISLNLGANKNSTKGKTIPALSATIYKKDGTTITLPFTSIDDNWNFIATTPSILPESGDTYKLSSVLSIEDPYLLDGFWYGSENENIGSSPNSGLNMYRTSKNVPYDKGYITGLYITVPTSTTVILPQSGSLMTNTADSEWAFYPTSSNNTSDVYSDSKRYIIEDTANENSGSSIQKTEMKTATAGEATTFLNTTGLSFVRIEISNSGGPSRNNFHANCLKNCYINLGGSYYKILDQIDGNVIDVSVYSIGGTKLVFPADNVYAIYNEYGWKINEYEMSDSRTKIFSGTITTVSQNTATIQTTINVKAKGNNTSTMINLPIKSYTPSYMPTKSFFNRFYLDHIHATGEPIKLYKKCQNWKFFIDKSSYNVNSIIVTPPTQPNTEYTYAIVVNGLVNTTDINKNCYITLDEPYKYDGTFDGSLNISMAQGLDSSNNPTLCLNGYWISPQVSENLPSKILCVGICDGRYFGIGTEAYRNDTATLFVTTPYGNIGTAALYTFYNNEEWVMYWDYLSKKLSIRSGLMNFTDFPRKKEVVIGQITESVATTVPITLDQTKERVKSIAFDLPTGKTGSALTFTTGNETNYFGFPIAHYGKDTLNPLLDEYKGITVPSNGFTNNGVAISPVFVYTNNDLQKLNSTKCNIGIDTAEKNIYVKDGTISNVIINYILNNQTISTGPNFDLHKISDGEYILVYGQYMNEFNVKSETTDASGNKSTVTLLNNSSKADPSIINSKPNEWKFSKNSIMILGTIDNGETWSCPIAKSTVPISQSSLMVLNAVEFLDSMYDERTQKVILFIKCYTKDGRTFLGAYIISILELTNKLLFCDFVDTKLKSFIYRPPALEDSVLKDETLSYVTNDNIINDGYSYSGGEKDKFIRIAGDDIDNGSTSATVNGETVTTVNKVSIQYDASTINNLNGYIFSSGMYCLLFDGTEGVRGLFSNSCGLSWTLSEIVLGPNGSSGLIIEGRLFYVTEFGIEFKNTSEVILQQLADATKGKNLAEIETVRTDYNKISSNLIFSGSIKPQRLSGYKDDTGKIKIFFYIHGLLSSVEGNFITWTPTNNF